ncbi:hypothetical protein KA183_13675 [bacterium]|nr:hypothetical protein [bacterium]QQR56424.1 MAG: hypothetical protein IPG59_15610 [Candidatus Melainabacteria bacterium]
MANMADIPETGETQESGESREIKLAQTDTKTKQESTITDESRQKTWQQANTQGHARDQHPSEIELPALVQSSFGIDFGDGQILTAKGIEQKEQIGDESSNWFESVKSTDFEQMQLYQDVQSDSISPTSDSIIASDLGKQIKQGYYNFEHPGRSNLDEKVDYTAAKSAFQAFNFGKYDIDSALIPAIIRNEQYFLKPKDTQIQDPLVEEGQIPKLFNWTIGPAQMKVRTIEDLVKKYPEQLTNLTEPTIQAARLAGMTIAEREATIAQKALEPKNAPILVGAYFADKIDRLERGLPPCPDRPQSENDTITKLWQSGDQKKRTEALIRTYNPADPNHVGNVMKQMKEIRQLHPNEI